MGEKTTELEGGMADVLAAQGGNDENVAGKGNIFGFIAMLPLLALLYHT